MFVFMFDIFVAVLNDFVERNTTVVFMSDEHNVREKFHARGMPIARRCV